MPGMIASIDWSATAVIGSGPIAAGTGVTSATGGYVAATTGNLATSPSGACEGIAATATDGILPFQVLTAGRVAASQLPGVGTGNATDYAVLNAAGTVVRSSTYVPGLTVGVCGKDGSATIQLNLPPPGVTGPTKTAVTTTAATVGYAAVRTGDAIDPTHIRVATASARAISSLAVGIYVANFAINAVATYADVGARIAASVTGLTPPPFATFVVADSTGKPMRKDTPDPGDLVLGDMDLQATLHFFPQIWPSSNVSAQNPSMRAAIDFSTGVGDVLQRRIDAAAIGVSEVATGSSSRIIQLEHGGMLLDHPLHIWNARTTLRGSDVGSTHLYSSSWAGPSILISPYRGSMDLALNDFAGGNSVILDGSLTPQRVKWFELSEDGAAVNINGWSQFEVEFAIESTQNGTYGFGGTIIASGGTRHTTDPGVPFGDTTLVDAFYINRTSGSDTFPNTILFSLWTTTGQTFFYAPNNAIPVDGHKHKVKCNYDGSNMRIIIDEVVVATQAKTGTISQMPWETVNFGQGLQGMFNNSRVTNVPFAKIPYIIIRDIASQTTSGTLTLPTSKPVYPPVDPHITFQCNFDDYYPPLQVIAITGATNANPIVISTGTPHGLDARAPYPFVIANVGGNTAANDTWNVGAFIVTGPNTIQLGAAGSGAYTGGGNLLIGGTFTKAWVRQSAGSTNQCLAYFPNYQDNPAFSLVPRVRIENMAITQISGTGVVSCQSPVTWLENLFITSRCGARIRNNNFESVIHRCTFVQAGAVADKRWGIQLASASYMSRVSQCDLSGFDIGILAIGTDISLSGLYLAVCTRPFIGMAMNNLYFHGMTAISDEGSATKADNQISLIGVANASFDSIQITAAQNSVPCLVVDQVNLLTLNTTVTLDNCTWASMRPDAYGRSVPGLIKVIAGQANPMIGGIEVRSPTRAGGVSSLGIPWIDPASVANFPIRLFPDGAIGTKSISIAGLTTYAMTRDDQLSSTIIFTGALTADCVVTTPAVNIGKRDFIDATTGAHVVTLKASGGTNVLTVPKSPNAITARYDGIDVRNP